MQLALQTPPYKVFGSELKQNKRTQIGALAERLDRDKLRQKNQKSKSPNNASAEQIQDAAINRNASIGAIQKTAEDLKALRVEASLHGITPSRENNTDRDELQA